MTSTQSSGLAEASVIRNFDQLVQWLRAGIKPESQWRIGSEHEKIGIHGSTGRPLPYEGATGIAAMLQGLMQFGWQAVKEGGHVIALIRPKDQGGGEVSLEPGGQLELSARPHNNLHDLAQDYTIHAQQVQTVAQTLGQRYLTIGYVPFWDVAQAPHMPKARYDIMRRYLQTTGTRGLEMMYLSAASQISLDYSSEADMVKKLRLGMALQPLAVALFANSPFRSGQPRGVLSERNLTWAATDDARTGFPCEFFAPDFGFARYAQWALQVPMYFVRRNGHYTDMAGEKFQDFLDGRLPQTRDISPRLSDWEDHLGTLFPEARLKRYIELRGADTGSLPLFLALAAFWVGLFYHTPSLQSASDYVASWSLEELSQLRIEAAQHGLQASIQDRSLQEVAKDILPLSQAGLRARKQVNQRGADESIYLAPALAIADKGQNPAQYLLEQYNSHWGKDLAPLIEYAQLSNLDYSK